MRRVQLDMTRDQVPLVAAGVAFYWLLAVFPAIAAAVTVWALVGNPMPLASAIETYGGLIPQDVVTLMHSQMAEVRSADRQLLTFLLTMATSLWAANNGVKGLVSGLNVVWDLVETRNFFARTGVAFALLVLGVAVGVLASLLFAALPIVSSLITVADIGLDRLTIARWPLIAVAMVAYLSVLYRVAPCRRAPPRSWITPGALVATALFLAVSAGFTMYVENFGSYNETYGSLGGGVVLLLWFWLTAMAVLVGAELDAEVEREFHADHLDTVRIPHR